MSYIIILSQRRRRPWTCNSKVFELVCTRLGLVYCSILQAQGRKFATGDKNGVWGTEVPQRGPGAEAPRSWRHMLNIRLNKAIDRHKSRTVQSLIIL